MRTHSVGAGKINRERQKPWFGRLCGCFPRLSGWTGTGPANAVRIGRCILGGGGCGVGGVRWRGKDLGEESAASAISCGGKNWQSLSTA